MEPKLDEFLSVGMSRYKQASATLIAFRQEAESRLERILEQRPTDRWGRFVPGADERQLFFPVTTIGIPVFSGGA